MSPSLPSPVSAENQPDLSVLQFPLIQTGAEGPSLSASLGVLSDITQGSGERKPASQRPVHICKHSAKGSSNSATVLGTHTCRSRCRCQELSGKAGSPGGGEGGREPPPGVLRNRLLLGSSALMGFCTSIPLPLRASWMAQCPGGLSQEVTALGCSVLGRQGQVLHCSGL